MSAVTSRLAECCLAVGRKTKNNTLRLSIGISEARARLGRLRSVVLVGRAVWFWSKQPK